jgi:hypothetical protein
MRICDRCHAENDVTKVITKVIIKPFKSAEVPEDKEPSMFHHELCDKCCSKFMQELDLFLEMFKAPVAERKEEA